MLNLCLLYTDSFWMRDRSTDRERGQLTRVDDLGGVQQLTGEDHQGQVIGGESRLECFIESPCLDE